MEPQTSTSSNTRILILGGGFAGVYTARYLQKRFGRRSDVQITLVSRDNFLLMTPLMFEVCSGTLEVRDCSISIREFLRTVRFIEATVEQIDLDRRVVRVSSGELPYDQLVLTLGGTTNTSRIPGSDRAFTFKTLADAIVLRNHVIERFERADAEPDRARRRIDLTFIVIGGGLVGVEIFGELTAFMQTIFRYYPRIGRDELQLILLEAGERIMPEVPARLADYAVQTLRKRPGVVVRTSTPVQQISSGRVHLKDEILHASTIVLSAGIVPSPVVAALPVEKDHHGKIVVDATMRCKQRPEIWAAGDCASIPGPQGRPYSDLAQHAMREAKVLAGNIHAAIDGGAVKPFDYKTIGIMASLGNRRGLGSIMGLRIRGFFAWWVRRTYYLLVTPRMPQRVRIVADWTIALMFRPSLTKIDLDVESRMLLRTGAAGDAPDSDAPGSGQAHAAHRLNRTTPPSPPLVRMADEP